MSFLDSITGLDVLKGGLSLINASADRKAQQKMNDANIAMQRETNMMQQDMMREQNAFNERMAIDMFNRENEYNTPLKQVERMREAGLNPAMMMDNGQIVNTGNISTPSAANIPSLTAPYMNKVEPITKGVLDSLQTIAEIQLKRSQSKTQDSETWRNYKKTDSEIQSLMADVQYKESLSRYQNLQTFLDGMFAPFERNAHIKEMGEKAKNLAADTLFYEIKGDTEKANQAFLQVEKLYKETQNDQLKRQFPLVLAQLQEQIDLLQQQQKTEASKQELNKSSSSVNRGLSALYSIQADMEAAKRDWMTNRNNNEYGFPTESNLEKIFNAQFRQQLSTLAKTDKEAAKIDKEIENLFIMAQKNQKELNWWTIDHVWNMLIDFSEQNRKAASTFLPYVTPFKVSGQ